MPVQYPTGIKAEHAAGERDGWSFRRLAHGGIYRTRSEALGLTQRGLGERRFDYPSRSSAVFSDVS